MGLYRFEVHSGLGSASFLFKVMDLGSVYFEVHLGSDLSSDNLYSMHSRNINYLFTFCFMKKKITKKEFTKKIYFLCIVCIEC